MTKTPKRGLKASILKQWDANIAAMETTLASIDDPVIRVLVAADLSERARVAQETFGELRTAGFVQLRDEGWSLGDLAEEFGLTRARVAQVACRDRYKSGESRGGGSRKGRRA